MTKDITLREHLTNISKKRWKRTPKADRVKHGQMMNAKRWTRERTKALKEGEDIKFPGT